MVEHRNVVNFFLGMDDRIPHDPPGTWLAVTSLSFDISVLELSYSLSRGFKVVLASDDDRAMVSGDEGAAQKPMDFSLFYFASDEGGEGASNKYKLLLEGAKFADENDFVGVWTPERHFGTFGGLYPNPAVAGAALAVTTKNVRIMAGSCVVPLHHPARIAEEWALVDNLSQGRVAVSIAAGWHPNDFLLQPGNFPGNKDAMWRDLDIIQQLWRGDEVTFEGPKGPVTVRTMPRPIQKQLPIWVTTAGNPETFKQAGKLGANILTHLLGQSVEELAEKIQAYREAWQEAGHPGQGYVSLMLHTFVGDNDNEVREIVREPMKAYLRSSIMLIAQHAWSFPAFKKVAKEGASFNDSFMSMPQEDMDDLLDFSFERYFETSGLFGTPETCLQMVNKAKSIGVNDIACLIDYGVDTERVLDSLPLLNEVRQMAQPVPAEADFSLAAQIARHKVTHFQCTPSMARMLVANEEARSALRTVQNMMVGGEALPGALAGELKAAGVRNLSNMYGPTETTIWSAVEDVHPCEGTVSIGTPIANTQLYVVDKNLQPVPVGVPGELLIGGDGVTRGYHNRAELTDERFVPDPYTDKADARLYRTGDLVKYRADGHLEFLGRMDHQVKLRGYRIELGEIESKLTAHDSVKTAVVMAREDQEGDPRLVAYIIPAPGASMDVETLKTHLRVDLPTFMVPAHFVQLTEFPLTPNNKIDRKALPAPDAVQAPSTAAFVAPESETQAAIAAVWGDILGLPQVGVNDNFFELGGHSLLAVRAHRQLKQKLTQPLTVTDIFRFPTVSDLAAHLDGTGEAAAKTAEAADRGAKRREAMAARRRRRG